MTFLHSGNKEHEIILYSEMSAAKMERSSSCAPSDAEVRLRDSPGSLGPTTGRGWGWQLHDMCSYQCSCCVNQLSTLFQGLPGLCWVHLSAEASSLNLTRDSVIKEGCNLS